MNKLQIAEHIRKALNLFAQTLNDETALEICGVYDEWEAGKTYSAGEFIVYGVNSVGDNQLYKVVQAHTSQSDWTPNTTPALYSAVGLDDNGFPIWSQPTGAHDAYNTGDVVDYNGTLYVSVVDGNVYSPEAYPAGWTVYNG